jgi:transposase InsO family protein
MEHLDLLRRDQTAALQAGGQRRGRRREIERIYDDNFKVYGARKIHRQMNRDGIAIGRCRVQRLMRQAGIQGVSVERSGAPRSETAGLFPAQLPEEFSRFFEVAQSAIERRRSWGKSMHTVVVGGDIPRFEAETAVGVTALCEHTPV